MRGLISIAIVGLEKSFKFQRSFTIFQLLTKEKTYVMMMCKLFRESMCKKFFKCYNVVIIFLFQLNEHQYLNTPEL